MVSEILPGVFWVGVVDWDIRQFHGHELSTNRGTTYNAYLIRDERTALIDTVGERFADRLLENIREVIDPAQIDVVVTNHAEPDHAGALGDVMRHAPQATLVVSPRGAESVSGLHHQPWNFRTVKTGERISLGRREMIFVEAPMLHWPDSMFTYLTGSNLLMPNDAFGQHYATDSRFNDSVDRHALYREALKYYANILTPFSPLVLRKIQDVLALGLPVDMIAPSHGVIWREDPLQIVHAYQEWAEQKPERRAVVLYDTMWGATRRMAEAIGDGLNAGGVPFQALHLSATDRNEVLTETFRAGAVIVGSPTINQGLLGSVSVLLEDLTHLKFRIPIGAAFGSYGWGGESARTIQERLKACGMETPVEPLRVKWQPRAEDLQACEALGRSVAERVTALPAG
jgi:flavorubredoxin